MKLTVKLFAVARQRIGRGQIELELPEAATVGNLRGAIVEQFPPLADVMRHARVAVDNEYAGDGDAVGMRNEIAVIPPVSGG
jgi:Molybdopterin converting factor, small subunit